VQSKPIVHSQHDRGSPQHPRATRGSRV